MNRQECSLRYADAADQSRWDAYIASHPQGSPYHLFAWKQAVEEAYNHKGYYLLAEKNGQIEGVLPLIHLRFPFLVNELTSLPFCDVGNLLSSSNVVTELLLKKALELSNTLHTLRIHLRGNVQLPDSYSDTLYVEKINKVRMFLKLPDSSDSLLNGFKSKLRSQIRKAEKNGLIFSWGDREDIQGYYSVFSENMRDLGSPVHSRLWFEKILRNFGNHAKMGLVSFENQVVGCCIILSVGATVAIPWASTLRKFNRLSPNMLLYWNVLKYAADAGFATFDFGRSSKGEGTYKFKKQWGAQPTPLKWYTTTVPQNDFSKEDDQAGKSGRERVAEIWSRLPLPLANTLGPKIRKYISL